MGIKIADCEAAEAKANHDYEQIARGNIERHLDVDVDGYGGDAEAAADAIYDEAYTLAFDAIVDAGCPHDRARDIAKRIATLFAQA